MSGCATHRWQYVAGCEGCRANQRERVRRNRAERLADGRISHGTRSGRDAGCSCDDCVQVRRMGPR